MRSLRRVLIIPIVALTGAALACTLSWGSDQPPTPTPSPFTPFYTPLPIFTPTPFFTPTPLPPTATACVRYTAWPVYTVVAGDTLGSIAQRANTTIAQLVAANCLTDSNLIYVGQQLYVPQLPATLTPTPITPTPVTPAPGAPVFGQALTAEQHWRDSTGQPITYYRTVRLNVGEVPTADVVSFFVTGPAGGAAAYIGQDADPWDGAFVDYTFPAPGTYTFQAVAESDMGRVSSAPFTVRYDPNFVPPGGTQYNTLSFSPTLGTAGGVTSLRAGAAVTITWRDAPGGAVRVDFLFTASTGGVQTIGSDATPADGAAMTWTVPAGIVGTVQARATMPNGQVLTSEAASVRAQ